MENDVNCVRLVKRAQLGDKESLERLSKLAEESLRDDVYRMTLEHDLTEDIVQETVLEMLKILGKLEEADRFWPWLYKIALNKMRLHRRGERLRSTVPISAVGDIEEPGDGREAMSELAARELKAIIFGAMGRLKPGQREVLTMRCYKEMDYSAIAATLGCSEFTARKRFWRAKKALQKQLARKGFGRGSLLMALVLFGKMTAASEAAAGHVSVTAATIKVGAAASLVGVMASKTAVVTLAAAGVIGAGAIVATSEPENAPGMVGMKGHESSQAGGAAGRAEKVAGEYLYYFPEGTDAPMMMRAMESDSKGKSYFCKWMQDEEGNYVFDRRKGVLHINNYRQFNGDLSVWRVPTDGSALRDFLSQVTGRVDEFEYGGGDVAGLMAVVRHGENGRTLSVSRHRRLLDEEYFRYSWHGGTRRVDGRDEMHRRGWTYFRISGRIGGERVSGIKQHFFCKFFFCLN